MAARKETNPGATSPTEFPSGHRVGKYVIKEKIGQGGMGAVYLAEDSRIKRHVALKLLPPEKASNPTLVKRFHAEATSAARMSHENIVTVYEAGTALDGQQYIALEYVEGTDVARLIDTRGVLPFKRSLEIVKQLAKALEHAHAQGIVHRDIKPANFLIRRDGTVKLADMGLARCLEESDDTRITRIGTTVGTVDYMAPEQARDSSLADIRSDIYSLGCSWYHMVTGTSPYPTGSLTNKLRAHAEGPIPNPRDKNPKLPEGFVPVLKRMLAKDPKARYQSPTDLLKDLDRTSFDSSFVSNAVFDDEATGHTVTREESPSAPPTGRRTRVVADDVTPVSETSRRGTRGRHVNDSDGEADTEEFEPHTPAKPAPAVDKNRRKPVPEPDDDEPAYHPSAKKAGLRGQVDDDDEPTARGTTTDDDDDTTDTAEERLARRRKSKPVVKTVDDDEEAGSSRRKSGSRELPKADEDESQKRSWIPSAALFYLLIALGIGGTLYALNWMAQQYGNSIAGNRDRDRKVNPFAQTGDAPDAPSGTAASTADRPDDTVAAAKKKPPPTTPQDPKTAPVPPPKDVPKNVAMPARNERPPLPTEVRTVVEGKRADGVFPSINEALTNVPSGGVVVRLAGPGPFVVRPVKLDQATHIVLQPQDDGVSPLVLMLPQTETGRGPIFDMRGTHVTFRRVHLVTDAELFSNDEPVDLVRMKGGRLSVDTGSVTVRGDQRAIRAFHYEASENTGDPSLIEVSGLLTRGSRLTPLKLDVGKGSCVLRDSLFFTGDSPAIDLTKVATATEMFEVWSSRLTTCGRRNGIRYQGDSKETEAAVRFVWTDSLLASLGDAEGSVLFGLADKTQGQAKDILGKALGWNMFRSVFPGWKTLVALDPSGSPIAENFEQWDRLWRDLMAGSAENYPPNGWPVGVAPRADQLSLVRFSPDTLPKIGGASGEYAGCPLAAVELVKIDPIVRILLREKRPKLPPAVIADRTPARTIQVDLTKEDLGRVIGTRGVIDNTLIIASGFGSRACTPFVIQNAFVRIRFQQTDGYPLVLTPRLVETPKPPPGVGDDAFITVVRGGLKLENAALHFPASERTPLPRWMLNVVDGDLILENSRFHGPMIGTTRTRGLVNWARQAALPPQRPFPTDRHGFFVANNCFFLGSGTLVQADFARRQMSLSNSVFAARDNAFQFQIASAAKEDRSFVDMSHCTTSVAETAFVVTSKEPGASEKPRLSIFADECVFGPAIKATAQKPTPTMLLHGAPVLAEKHLEWSEYRCGYATDFSWYVRPEGNPPPEQKFVESWVGTWGSYQIFEPQFNLGGVLLVADLPPRNEIRPHHYQLHGTCKALGWGDGGKPIGVLLHQLRLPPFDAPTETTPKPKPKLPVTKPKL